MESYSSDAPSERLTILAGMPATVQPAGTDFVTTAFAPITAPSPTSMSPRSMQPQPSSTSLPTLGTRSPGTTPPPGRANRHMLEESAVPPHHRVGVDDTTQARVVENARRIYPRADSYVAAEQHAVDLPQEESCGVPQLAVAVEPVGEQGYPQVRLIGHGRLPLPHRRTRLPPPSRRPRRSACHRTSCSRRASRRSRAWRRAASPRRAFGRYRDP